MDNDLKAILNNIKETETPKGLDLSESNTISIKNMHPDDIKSIAEGLFESRNSKDPCKPGLNSCLTNECTFETLICIAKGGNFLDCMAAEVVCQSDCYLTYCGEIPLPGGTTTGGTTTGGTRPGTGIGDFGVPDDEEGVGSTTNGGGASGSACDSQIFQLLEEYCEICDCP